MDPVGDVVDQAGAEGLRGVRRMRDRGLARGGVMNLGSAMAVSTVWARRSAPSGLRLGASRDGDLTRPARIAASAT